MPKTMALLKSIRPGFPTVDAETMGDVDAFPRTDCQKSDGGVAGLAYEDEGLDQKKSINRGECGGCLAPRAEDLNASVAPANSMRAGHSKNVVGYHLTRINYGPRRLVVIPRSTVRCSSTAFGGRIRTLVSGFSDQIRSQRQCSPARWNNAERARITSAPR